MNGADQQIAGLQYRPLLLQGASDYIPVLASSWSSNSNATVWTFHLASTKWSDGTPFTAADVVYSFDTYTNPATKSTYAGTFAGVVGAADFTSGKAKDISGITAPNDHTVKITLAAPNASFVGGLTNLNIVPKHIFESIDPATFSGSQMFHEPSVGIGPYTFSKWVNAGEIEFVPNKMSAERHPLAHIYAQYETGSTAEAQLQTGEIDIAQVAAADVAQLKGSSGVNIVESTGNSVMSLWTALDNGLLSNAKVRQAILYAIDRQSIVKNVLAGHATVPQTMIFKPSWALPKNLVDYSYNPTKAKELLKAANWNPSTPVNLDIVPGQADRDATMTIIAGELQAVGINAKVTQLQPAQVSALVSTDRKDFDLLITVLAVNPADPGATISQRYTTTGTLNISKYSNARVDQLSAEGMSTSNQSKRQSIYKQINSILNGDVPSIPLYVEQSIWGTTSRVHGFDPITALQTAENWTVSSK
ncbi:ABC transporter substrate-binding protein [Humibacter ginsengiterrae]